MLSCVRELGLVDHHCHGVLRSDPDRDTFERWLTEADGAAPAGTTRFDTQTGLAVRRWCAPVLDLPAHATAEEYLARRAELGATETNRRLLRATGCTHYLVDAGLAVDTVTAPGELAELAGAPADEVLRLERIAEDVALAGSTASGFADAVTGALRARVDGAVATKSIAAYRVGLELAGERPGAGEVRDAAGRWLSEVDRTGRARLAERVLHRFLIWAGVDLGLPVQIHVGYGDTDLDLHRADPLLLTDLLRATRHTGVPIMLLHNYPFHRHAGYLAQVFEHVFVDVGLAVPAAGWRSAALIAETLEITPFGKFLFSSDAFGLAELFHLGAVLFRRGLSDFLRAGLAEDALSTADAERIALLVGSANAQRVYRLA